jgi:antibiotic biosynthesis monooxygenase (ABM) superfamily enzyme
VLRKAAFPLGVWLCVYPLVTGLLMALRATGLHLPLPLQTLLVTAVLVPTMIFGLVPLVRKLTQENRNV